MPCDGVVLARDAKLSLVFLQLGLPPDLLSVGSVHLLPPSRPSRVANDRPYRPLNEERP